MNVDVGTYDTPFACAGAVASRTIFADTGFFEQLPAASQANAHAVYRPSATTPLTLGNGTVQSTSKPQPVAPAGGAVGALVPNDTKAERRGATVPLPASAVTRAFTCCSFVKPFSSAAAPRARFSVAFAGAVTS